MGKIHFLSVQEVIHMHRVQIMKLGGIHGIRDFSLLESAIKMPQMGIDDQYFHADIPAQAAAYLYHLVKNHPFFDGNKRTGAITALVFLDSNNINFVCTNDEIYIVTMQIAMSQITKDQLANFFRMKVVR